MGLTTCVARDAARRDLGQERLEDEVVLLAQQLDLHVLAAAQHLAEVLGGVDAREPAAQHHHPHGPRAGGRAGGCSGRGLRERQRLLRGEGGSFSNRLGRGCWRHVLPSWTTHPRGAGSAAGFGPRVQARKTHTAPRVSRRPPPYLLLRRVRAKVSPARSAGGFHAPPPRRSRHRARLLRVDPRKQEARCSPLRLPWPTPAPPTALGVGGGPEPDWPPQEAGAPGDEQAWQTRGAPFQEQLWGLRREGPRGESGGGSGGRGVLGYGAVGGVVEEADGVLEAADVLADPGHGVGDRLDALGDVEVFPGEGLGKSDASEGVKSRWHGSYECWHNAEVCEISRAPRGETVLPSSDCSGSTHGRLKVSQCFSASASSLRCSQPIKSNRASAPRSLYLRAPPPTSPAEDSRSRSQRNTNAPRPSAPLRTRFWLSASRFPLVRGAPAPLLALGRLGRGFLRLLLGQTLGFLALLLPFLHQRKRVALVLPDLCAVRRVAALSLAPVHSVVCLRVEPAGTPPPSRNRSPVCSGTRRFGRKERRIQRQASREQGDASCHLSHPTTLRPWAAAARKVRDYKSQAPAVRTKRAAAPAQRPSNVGRRRFGGRRSW